MMHMDSKRAVDGSAAVGAMDVHSLAGRTVR